MKQILLSLLFLLTASTWAEPILAQNNTWLIVSRKANYKQSYRIQTGFPEAYIQEQIKLRRSIASMTYDNKRWMLVMSAQGHTAQRHLLSSNFPSAFIDRGWADGLSITELAYGDKRWAVVLSRGTDYTRGAWRKGSLESVRQYIDERYKQGRYIVALANGAGDWAVAMAATSTFTNQSYRIDANFPKAWIDQNYTKGMRISNISYGDGVWFVIMSRLRGAAPQERYEITQQDPQSYIKTQWDAGMRISEVHFNTETGQKVTAHEYFNLALRYAEQNDHDRAIEHYTEALRLDPRNADAYNNRAWSKYLLGQCQGALPDVSRSIELAITPENLHTRGAIYLCLNRCRDANVDFNRALGLANKKEAYMYADRAKARTCIGDYPDAIEDYKQAARLDPKEPAYAKARQELESRVRRVQVAAPTITWDYPYSAFTSSTKATCEIKACIAGSKPRKTEVFINGKSFASRGFGVEDDCLENVQQTIRLENGRNEVQIVVTANDGSTVRSEKRTIEYRPQSSGNNHALILSVGNYPDASIANLSNPAKDGAKLRNVLTSQYTFNPADVYFLEHPTKEQILDRLAYLQDRLGPNDNLLIFYSGHGIVRNEVGYWLPSDAKQSSRASWLSNAELRDYINGMKTKHTLVIADACFSGAILTGGYRDMNQFACQEMARMPSRRAMTSGANTVVPDNSVFFRYFIQNLENNTSSCITAEELYNKVKPAVIYNSPNNHIPQFGVLPQAGDEGGNFIFNRK